ALAGLEPQGPLTAAQIWPTGRPGGQGLVVVGSHVGLTSRQVAKAQKRGGLTETELHVPTLLDPERRDDHVAAIGRQVAEALATSDVLLFTSRPLLPGGDADDTLATHSLWAAPPTTALPSPAPSPPRSSRWSRPRSPRIRHGSSPKAASPPTMS